MTRKNAVIISVFIIIIIGAAAVFSKEAKAPGESKKKATAPQASGTAGATGNKDEGSAKAELKSGGRDETEVETPKVEIPDDRRQLIGVKTVEASVRSIGKSIRTVGRVEYNERGISAVTMKFEGWIEKLHVDYTGRVVKKGEPLAEVYSPELMATQQELINAVDWAKNTPPSPALAKGGSWGGDISRMLIKDSGRLAEAARRRLRLWDITDEQIKNIEETGKPLRTLTLYSPSSGYVLQKNALQGMRAMPGDRLFDIADLSSVWVVADVFEHDLLFVKEGQTARIGLSYFPGKEFAAKVDYVYPALAQETKTAKIRFTIANPDRKLKPQMFTNVELQVDLGRRLVVPDDAVIDTGIREVVYVDAGDGYFEPREVMTGVRADGMTEVTRGLKAGEKVASSANFLIDSEAQLKGIKPLGLKKQKTDR